MSDERARPRRSVPTEIVEARFFFVNMRVEMAEERPGPRQTEQATHRAGDIAGSHQRIVVFTLAESPLVREKKKR